MVMIYEYELNIWMYDSSIILFKPINSSLNSFSNYHSEVRNTLVPKLASKAHFYFCIILLKNIKCFYFIDTRGVGVLLSKKKKKRGVGVSIFTSLCKFVTSSWVSHRPYHYERLVSNLFVSEIFLRGCQSFQVSDLVCVSIGNT